MLKQEEIRFNETKKRFEETFKELEEAKRAYDSTWSWSDVKFGINEEQYMRMLEFIQTVQENIPKRDFIVFKEETIEEFFQSNLPVQNERKNFFTNIINFFKRLINRNREENQNNPEYEEPIIITGEPQEEQSIPDDVVFDVDSLIQECRQAHEEFIASSDRLDNFYEIHLNDSPKGRVIGTKHDGPGILDDYRQGSWGIERICLDGFQNHLPADSKGTKCYLHFLVGNKWVDVETAKQNRDKIRAVRFADNGVGFTFDNLFYLHSTKSSEDISAGQFGEGMKLASIASVNLGLGLEFQSRNWRAIAGSEEKKIVNTRKGDEKESRKKLIYDVTVYDGEPIGGSRTIFHTPTPEFIDYALQLPERVLELGKKQPIFVSRYGEIAGVSKSGQAFVKGIYLTDINSFFSYNFNDANVNPDRNGFHNFNESGAIHSIIADLDNPDIIKDFLSRLLKYTERNDLWNKELYSWKSDHPMEIGAAYDLNSNLEYSSESRKKIIAELWKKAFEEVCSNGELGKDGLPKKPILKTDYEIPEYLKETLNDYILVKVPKNWMSTLQKAGIQIDKDVIPEYVEEKIQTSLTLDYGDQIWDNQRILLDACQNHLPADCKGSNIFLRFQTTDGKWHDYREFDKFQDSEIEKIKISDDGIGYDYKHLGLFASVKKHADSSGKWGEGLKMLAAASVRNGVQIELRSRDWLAIPETQTEILNEGKTNEKKVDRLVFVTKKRVELKSKVLDDRR